MTGFDFSHPRVNLIPRLEIERRRRHRVKRGWTIVVIFAAAIAVLLIGAAWTLNFVSSQRLALEQNRAAQLSVELESRSDINTALGLETSLAEMRAQAMGADLSWIELFDRVAGRLPEDLIISGYTITSGPIVGETDTSSDDEANPDPGPRGTVTLAGSDWGAVTRAADAILADDAVVAFELSGTVTEGELSYTTYEIEFTADVNSGRYTSEEQ